MKKLLIISILLTSFQIPRPYQKYIEENKSRAQLLQATHGIPASIQLAQAIIESGGGRSRLAKNAKNHFGIRCGDNWKGETHYTKSGCWRCYSDSGVSWIDHADFLCKYYSTMCGRPWNEWESLEGYGGKGYWKEVVRIIKKYKLYELD